MIATIIYASETNKGMKVAERIFQDCEKEKIHTELYEFCDYQKKFELNDPKRIFIMIVSSTQDGDAPDNGYKLCKELKKLAKNPVNSTKLFTLKFTILGLGDSSYSSFMVNPVTMKKSLVSLGAKIFY